MHSSKLFGNRISPACRHCTQGYPTPGSNLVLCTRRGAVSPDFACRHYQYDPLMRMPRRPLQLMPHREEEFQL